MDESRLSRANVGAVTAWLTEAENAFGLLSTIFENVASGTMLTPEAAARVVKTTWEFESQARQLRALVINETDIVQ
jgi:hypothetical protein